MRSGIRHPYTRAPTLTNGKRTLPM